MTQPELDYQFQKNDIVNTDEFKNHLLGKNIVFDFFCKCTNSPSYKNKVFIINLKNLQKSLKNSNELNLENLEFPEHGAIGTITNGDGSTSSHNISVIFKNFELRNANINFSNAVFGKGRVIFYNVTFKNCTLDFWKAQFRSEKLIFINCKFECNLYFWQTDFYDCELDFSSSHFHPNSISSNKEIRFDKAKFHGKNGIVSFKESEFHNINKIYFDRVDFGKYIVNFENSKFFDCKEINFKESIVNGVLSFNSITSNSVLDLRRSHISIPIDFYKSEIDYEKSTICSAVLNLCQKKIDKEKDQKPKKDGSFFASFVRHFLKGAKDPADSEKFRCLKEYAKRTGSHERVLDFYAKEQRSGYGHVRNKDHKIIVFLIYDLLSNFGRSVLRPGITLCLSIIIMTAIYYSESNQLEKCAIENTHEKIFTEKTLLNLAIDKTILEDALSYSMSNSFPLLLMSDFSRGETITRLWGQDCDGHNKAKNKIPALSRFLSYIQSIFSVVLLFLIAFAIRNKFKA